MTGPETLTPRQVAAASALTHYVTRKGLADAAVGMPYRAEARKRDIAAWLVRYRPEAVPTLIGWAQP